MANTISVMTNAVRGVVSKKRIRYQENGYDLDLAYVTDRLIAMGFPADKIESIYRNKLEDVKHFLEEKHKDHYKIYNLCSERHYHPGKFDGRVAEYPFVDHNPPPIKMIKEFCDDVDVWLKADKGNVAAVHCKAGKGRTGTMICCYLVHCQIKTTAESALAYYDEKRTKNKKGVTIPSQRRYVEYYAKLVNSGQPYEERPLQMCEIRFSSQLPNQDNIYCSIYPYPRSENPESTIITRKFSKNQVIDIGDCRPLEGDVKVEVYRKTMRKERYFHFWFNTFFICDNAAAYEDDGGEKKFVVELAKHELDDVHKDTEHKTVPQDFKVQLVFKPVPRDHHTITSVASHLRNNHKSPTMLRQHENHHPRYCQLQVSSNNIGNHHNNTANLINTTTPLSPVNHRSEPPTMTNPSAPRLSSMGSSSSGSSIGENQQPPPPTLTSHPMSNYSMSERRLESKHPNHSNTNHSHGDCNSIDVAQASYNCLGSNGRNSTTSAITTTDAHTPSVSSSRSGSINSSDPSSHSAGFGDDVGDEEEGWESGEFTEILPKRKENVNEVEIKNENDHKNPIAMMDADDCNSTVDVNTEHSSLVFPSSPLQNLSQDSSGNDCNVSFQNDSIVRNDKSRNLNINNLKRNNNNSCNNNNGNNKTNRSYMDLNIGGKQNATYLTDTTSSGSNSSSSKIETVETQQRLHLLSCDAANTTASTSSSTGCTKPTNNATRSSKSSSKSLGLHNTISNNNNTSKKVQQARRWLSTMRSDPNLGETLANSVHFLNQPLISSNNSSGIMIKQIDRRSRHARNVSSDMSLAGDSEEEEDSDSGRGLKYSSSNHRTKTNSTSEHDDYYSSLCDTQLSFGGSSPIKSPPKIKGKIKSVNLIGHSQRTAQGNGTAADNSLLKSTVVVAKPIESRSIGFVVPSNMAQQSRNAFDEGGNILQTIGRQPDQSMGRESDHCMVETPASIANHRSMTEQVQSTAEAIPTTICYQMPPMAASSPTAFALLSEDPKTLALISSSPPTCKANSCVPFSFSKLRHELQSVLRKNKTSSNSTSAKVGRNATSLLSNGKSNKPSLLLPSQIQENDKLQAPPTSNFHLPPTTAVRPVTVTTTTTTTTIGNNNNSGGGQDRQNANSPTNARRRDTSSCGNNDLKNNCDDDTADGKVKTKEKHENIDETK